MMPAVEQIRRRSIEELLVWGRLVKFSHTVFALPFALSMLLVVHQREAVSAWQVLMIVLALISARTAAMSFNRLADRKIDALNPRTQAREIPAGIVSTGSATLLLVSSAAVFLASAAGLGAHCLLLAPVVLGILFFYSCTKRFTAGSHLVLGLALSLAPGGVWYALTARVELLPVLLMGGVLFWVTGFDILYSCQDTDFDRKQGLHSVPARWGIARAFLISRVLHSLAVALLAGFGLMAGLGSVYYAGLGMFALILASQHFIISPSDLRRIDAAFFTRNGQASLVYFGAVLIEMCLQ